MRRPALALALVPLAFGATRAGAQPVAMDAVPGGLEAGTTITAENAEKVKPFLPEEIYAHGVEGFDGLQMTIVESREYEPHPKYIEATVKYACQAKLDENGLLTNYTAGQPFPFSEWAKEATGHQCDLMPDDPQFALKLAWNINYRWQGPGYNYPHWGFSYMRNRGNELWRLGQGEYRRTYFSHRADLLPETHQLEEGTDVEWAEFFDVKDPFDLRGTMFLLYRYITGKEDDTWAYVPSLRRVRRIATTQKSDSLLGTEFTLEDFYMFSGYVTDQKWEYKGETTVLAPMNTQRKCFPLTLGEDVAERVTGMKRLGSRDEWNACEYGPYGAMPFVNERWEPRVAFQIDDIPKQEGHPYSRKKLWYDKESMHPIYSLIYDRGGKPYKLMAHIFMWSEDSPNPANEGMEVVLSPALMIVNLQNENSHVIQMFNANVNPFPVGQSKQYFDITKLKKQGR